MRAAWPLVATLALLVAAAPAAPEDPEVELDEDRVPATRTGGDCLVRGATVHTISAAGTLEEVDVLVRDGRIEAVGHGLKAPEGVVVIDARGRHLTPGLIDCHSHIAIQGGVNEATESIVAEVRIADEVDHEDVSLWRGLAGGVTTAQILHGSANCVGGQSAVIKLRYGRPAPDLLFGGAPRGIKFALGENVKQSNWGDQARGTRFPNTRLGVEAVYRRAFAEARDYDRARRDHGRRVAAGEAGPGDAPRRDLRLETLAAVLSGEVRVHCHSYRADEVVMLIRVAEEHGVRIATFQHCLEAYKVAPEIAAHGAGVSTFSDWWSYKVEAYDAIPQNAALCTRAGVVTSINSDSAELQRHLWLEAAKCVRHGGLSAAEALALVTLNPARQLGIQDRVGSIEPGKDADLALFEGHPLSAYARCVMTLVDGEVYFEDREAPRRGADGFDPDGAPRRPPLALAADDAGRYAIVGAVVHPVSRGETGPATVLVEGGRVAALVGPGRAPPRGWTVVDATGLQLYPGLVDAGTELGLTEIGSVAGTRDTGEIGEVQPDLLAATAFHPASEHIPVSRAAGVTSALVAPRGGLVSGQASLMALDGWTPCEAAVVSPHSLHINFPAVPRPEEGPGKPDPAARERSRDRYRGELEALRGLFREALRLEASCREALRRGEVSPEGDPRVAAVLPYALGDRPVVFHADGAPEICGALDLAAELGLRAVIAGGRDAWKVTDRLARSGVPVILGPVLALPSEEWDPWGSLFASASRLRDAGVPFCLQTQESSNVRNLPFQAACASAWGLSREEALRAVTIDAARVLGVEGLLGGIEPGMRGDLILTTGDPLEVVTDVVAVFIGGRPVDLSNRHTRLAERYGGRGPVPGRRFR